MRRWHLAFPVLSILLLLPGAILAQAERYELGLRLRAFETVWEETTDAAARKRASAPLQKATPAFFSFRLDQAGLALDQARWALQGDNDPEPSVRWAESLCVKLATHFLDPAAGQVGFTVKQFYKSDAERPEKAVLRGTLLTGDGKAVLGPVDLPLGELPQEGNLSWNGLAEGDFVLSVEVVIGDKVLAQSDQGLSAAVKRDERLAELQKAVEALPAEPASTDRATLKALVRLLDSLVEKRQAETDYPAARLLAEAEAIQKAIAAGQLFHGRDRVGQFWMTLATDKATVPVRINVPMSVKEGRPVPLVVALHGAGGSENLFFDGYGRGAVVTLSEKRGWLCVSPRDTFGTVPVEEVIREVSRLYPVDEKKIFLVGHSMGAARAMAAARATPERFAAVAALGGGGAVRGGDALKALPFFIGIGDKDFALRGAKALKESLEKAEVKTVVYRDYPDVEHLAVVQVALPEVFSFFDKFR